MRILAAALLAIILIPAAWGQDTIPQSKPEKTKSAVAEKLFYGGSVGLSFGNYSRIAIYPYVGLRLTKSLRVALQPGYEHINDKRGDRHVKASNYGISLLTQYNIIPSLYLHLEPAIYSYDAYYIDEERVWVPFLFAGAGLHQRLGRAAVMYFQLKFDLIQNADSPYKDWAPFFDVGVAVGI